MITSICKNVYKYPVNTKRGIDEQIKENDKR